MVMAKQFSMLETWEQYLIRLEKRGQTNRIQICEGSNFEAQFSKTNYQLITPNLAINVGQPYPDNSTKYKVTLMVAEPESTTKENIPAQNKKVNSRKLLSGEHRWNILNNDELPEQTSLNNFTGNISLDQGNIDQTSADDKSASITIKDIELRSTKSYESFVDLLGDNWRKQRVRNQLLGTVMANIPGDDHTLRQFHSDVVERYSSIAYEKHWVFRHLVEDRSSIQENLLT